MENIIKEIELRYKTTKPYSLEIQQTESDLENPDFLGNLSRSAYCAYLQNDISFCNEILNILIKIPFDGNYDKWTWIESGIYLKMYFCLNNNEYDDLKQLIDNQFNYSGLNESTRKINLKVFNRRLLTGSMLQLRKNRVVQQIEQKNIDLEFMYSLSYFSELIFIYSMNKGNVDNPIKEDIAKIKNRLTEIILFYKNNQ